MKGLQLTPGSTPATACGCCGHRRDEHQKQLPAACEVGWNGDTIDPRDPGYGCPCIGWTPPGTKREGHP